MIYPSSFYAVPADGTVQTVRLVGRNADIDTGTVPEHVWSGGGLFTFLAAAEALTAVSADTNDTADPNGEPPAPGTGARTVTITGLTSAYAALTETLSLTSCASTGSRWRRPAAARRTPVLSRWQARTRPRRCSA